MNSKNSIVILSLLIGIVVLGISFTIPYDQYCTDGGGCGYSLGFPFVFYQDVGDSYIPLSYGKLFLNFLVYSVGAYLIMKYCKK